MKTCKELGIKTVAIYSDADAQAVSFPQHGRIRNSVQGFWKLMGGGGGIMHAVENDVRNNMQLQIALCK